MTEPHRSRPPGAAPSPYPSPDAEGQPAPLLPEPRPQSAPVDPATLPPPRADHRVAAPPPPGHLPPRSKLRTVALVLAGVLVTSALGWHASTDARENWWPGQPHEAVGVGEELRGITITAAELSALDSVESYDGPWPVPHGFQLWEISLAVQTNQQEITNTTVHLEDADGRRFTAGSNVPWSVDGYESYLTVDEPEADDEPLPEVQRMLVLTPADAEPVAIRVEGAYELNPQYFRLPVQG